MNSLAWKKKAQSSPFLPHPHHPGVNPSGDSPDDATQVIWQDPSSYDPFYHGPPYFPGMKVHMKEASFAGKMATTSGSDLPSVLVFLRALAAIHQSHHWLTCVPNYYGDHLLFERLYNQTQGEIDQVAEKAVGIGCPAKYIYAGVQARLIAEVVSSFCNVPPETLNSFAEISLHAEKHFLESISQIAEVMKSKGELSRGVDNLLAGIEDNHGGHVYLLQQRLKESTESWKVSK